MAHKFKQRKQAGFTIIEVMIVLAIAALILLVVLLAVPALQRNSRNTTIKNDASTIVGGINTYASDNNGTLPAYVGGTGTVNFDVSSTATANRETISVQGTTAVTLVTAAPSSVGTGTGKIAIGTIQAFIGTNCSGSASARAASVYYVTETSGTSKVTCIES